MRDILTRYPRPGPGDLLLLAPVFSVRVCFIRVSRSGDTELYRAIQSRGKLQGPAIIRGWRRQNEEAAQ